LTVAFVTMLAVLKYVPCDSQLWEAHAELLQGLDTPQTSAVHSKKGIAYLCKNRKGEYSLYKHPCDVNHNT